MSQLNRLQKERNLKTLLELASLPGNNICADCKARMPRWASHNLGIFICTNCARIHRGIGTHITKVKSLSMDDWTKEQIEHMKSMGNIKSNAIYNPNEIRNPPPPNLDDTDRDSEIEHHIRAKYEYKKFFDKSALAASILGPSRSAAAAPPKAATLPVTQPARRGPSPKPPINTTQTNIQKAIPSQPSNLTRSASQPVVAQPAVRKSNGASGGVWQDLSLLNEPSQNSTLPLQYQQSFPNPPQTTPVTSGLPTPAINSYQSQQFDVNTFPQQQTQIGFPSSSFSMQQPQLTSFPSQSFGQYPQSASAPSHGTFFQPQPQSLSSLQVQVPPTNPGFLTPSPSIVSAPSGQIQYLSPSPSQHFLSHSPQPQVQLQMLQSSTPQAQFMYQSSASAQPQMQFGTGGVTPVGQSFLGMTTMQMQQQLMLQQQQQQQQQAQQQQMQQQAMFNAMHPQMSYGQTFPQGGFPAQGSGAWGAL